LSVFKKQVNVDISGNYLEHFKRISKHLKTQSEQCPRRHLAVMGGSAAGSDQCVDCSLGAALA
jgi:hypothetical protein